MTFLSQLSIILYLFCFVSRKGQEQPVPPPSMMQYLAQCARLAHRPREQKRPVSRSYEQHSYDLRQRARQLKDIPGPPKISVISHLRDIALTIKAPQSPIKHSINHWNRPNLKLKLTPGTTAKQMLLTITIPVAKQLVVTSGWARVPILDIEV